MYTEIIAIATAMPLLEREHLGQGKKIATQQRALSRELVVKHEHIIRAN